MTIHHGVDPPVFILNYWVLRNILLVKQVWQVISSDGKPGKVMAFHYFFSRPEKVMEIDSRFWKIDKKSWKSKGILSRNGVVPFFHPVFQYNDTFM